MERKKKAPRHLGPQLKAVIRRQPTVFAVYTVLRLIVLATLVSSIIRGEYESAFICLLVLVLFTFLQPLLPNQFDPNLVNKFDEKAVWLIVDEDGKAKLSGIKYTKGDYAAETDGRNTTLAYVQAPEDWGNIKLYVQDKGGVAEEIAATADSENPGWYYAVISAEKPYMYVTSEDGE